MVPYDVRKPLDPSGIRIGTPAATTRGMKQAQMQEIAEIVRSYRNEEGSEKYYDMKGRCKVASIVEVIAAGYSLNPGRYIGTVENEISDEDFIESMKKLQTEFETLTTEAHSLEKTITNNFKKLF